MRHVRLRIRVGVQPLMPDVADHADDLHPPRWRAEADPLTDRIARRPEAPRCRLVDDDHGRRRLAVGVRERPAALKRNAHRAEVVGRHQPRMRAHWQRRLDRLLLDVEIQPRVEAAERQRGRHADALNAGHRAQALHQCVVERRRAAGIRVARSRQRQPRRRQMLGPEAGRHVDQPLEADQQQRRAGQQHERQRELGDDQRRSQAARADAAAAAARLFVQRHAHALIRRDHRRHDAEEHAGDRRQDERGAEHARIDADVRDARQARELRRQEHAKRGQRPRRDEQAGQTAREGDDDAAARRADRAANRQLTLTARCARQEQRRHVRARDEHHEADRGEQDEQRRAHVADQRIAQRSHARPVIPVLGRILLRQPRADHVQLFARLRHRDAGREPADHIEEMRAAERAIVVVERQRQEDFRLRRPPERPRQDADDFVRVAVEDRGAADDAGVGAEAATPQRVGQQHDLIASVDLFVVAQVAAERRSDAERREKRRRHAESEQALRLAGAGQVHRPLAVGIHRRDRPAVAPPVEEVRRRDRTVQPSFARPLLGDRHHPIRVGIRQRSPQHRVDNAEDGGVGADAERQRHQRDNREARLADEHPQAEPDVLLQRFPHRDDLCKL